MFSILRNYFYTLVSVFLNPPNGGDYDGRCCKKEKKLSLKYKYEAFI